MVGATSGKGLLVFLLQTAFDWWPCIWRRTRESFLMHSVQPTVVRRGLVGNQVNCRGHWPTFMWFGSHVRLSGSRRRPSSSRAEKLLSSSSSTVTSGLDYCNSPPYGAPTLTDHRLLLYGRYGDHSASFASAVFHLTFFTTTPLSEARQRWLAQLLRTFVAQWSVMMPGLISAGFPSFFGGKPPNLI